MKMKKALCASLALVLAAGCSTGSASSSKKSQDLYYVFSSDLKTTDYLITQNAADHDINDNIVDGLVEVDAKNKYVASLAESWEHNDDSSVWTFHLRKDAKWVTNTGEQYGTVKADDFVAGLQHAADFKSATLSLAAMHIKGLQDYADGKTKDFSTVGVKAVDDYTVEYTLTQPATYFDTLTSYTIFYPVNREFLEAQGSGCKLGSPDANNCKFGQPTEPSSILYNGAYILTSFVSKSEEKLTKNKNYWDADHVYINNVSLVYDDGSDPASTVKGFEQSENAYYQGVLLAKSDNFKDYLEKYKDNAYTGMQDQYTFGINFNMNRITYTTTDKTAAQQTDARAALLNKNFRLALKYGLDRVSYMGTAVDPSIAATALRNIECPWNFVTTTDGTAYGKLVEDASTLKADLSEGQDPFYNADTAKKYIESAKSELSGVTFPIKLDLMVDESSKTLVAQASSLKQSIEASLGTDNVQIIVHPVDSDTYEKSAYNSTGPVDADWDISTSTGWGYDYIDPKSYLHIFCPTDGDILRQNMGLEFEADGDAQNTAAIAASGLDEYQKLYDAADAITDDQDARYKAFAKAEAFILDEAIYIPVQARTASVNWRISREVPFQGGYLQSTKYKNRIIQKDAITAADYKKALETWQKG
jgi:ABC-type oligopeptide transport system substrate-binding subunit